MSERPPPSLRQHLWVLGGLLALLLATLGVAFMPLGRWNTVWAMAISVTKTALVMAFFMRLKRGRPFVRVVALAGFVWLAMLIVFTLSDFLTRTPLPAPW